MQAEQYTPSGSNTTMYRPVLTSNEAFMLDTTGFCVNCGAEAHGVEPDASRYRCDDCGERTVYGVEQLVLMGIARCEN